MARIPVVAPTIVRVSLHHNLTNGRFAYVVLDVSAEGGSGSDRATYVPLVAASLGKSWQTSIVPNIFSPVSYTGGSYVDLDSLDSTAGSFGPDGSAPIAGPAHEVPPPSVALLVTKNCHHSRSQRNGRLYMPGIREDFIDAKGEIGGSYMTGLQNSFDSFLADVAGTGGLVPSIDTALRVVHVTGHTDGKPSSWDSSDISSFTVQSRVGTIRRRNRG